MSPPTSRNLKKYRNLAFSMFEWSGIDDRGARLLESLMFDYGRCTIFEDIDEKGVKGPRVGRIAEKSVQLDWYGRFLKWDALGRVGDKRALDHSKGVICTSDDGNGYYIPVKLEIERPLYFLNESEVAYKIDMWKHSMPMVIEGGTATESNKNPANDMIQKARDDGKIVVVIKRGTVDPASQVLEPGTQTLKERFLIDRDYWDAEIKSILGIPYIAVEKKAPLVVDEATGGAAEIELIRALRLAWRQTACNEYNALFNPETPLGVSLRATSEAFHQDQTDARIGSNNNGGM